jgi:hypothetical protein
VAFTFQRLPSPRKIHYNRFSLSINSYNDPEVRRVSRSNLRLILLWTPQETPTWQSVYRVTKIRHIMTRRLSCYSNLCLSVDNHGPHPITEGDSRNTHFHCLVWKNDSGGGTGNEQPVLNSEPRRGAWYTSHPYVLSEMVLTIPTQRTSNPRHSVQKASLLRSQPLG